MRRCDFSCWVLLFGGDFINFRWFSCVLSVAGGFGCRHAILPKNALSRLFIIWLGATLRWLRRSVARLLAWCCMRRGAQTTQHAIKECGSQRRLRRRIQIRALCMRATYIFHMHRLPVRLLAIFQPLRFSELNGAPLKKCFINPSSSFLSFASRSAPLIAFSIWQSYNSQWISNSWHLHTII